MKFIEKEKHGDVLLVRLKNGPINALSPKLVLELQETLDDLKRGVLEDLADAPRGLVLAGGTKFFSIGLDLPTLLALNRESMTSFWASFEETVLKLYTLPVPTIAAIEGHATAGGLILALTCDFRFCAPGRKLLGLNEVKIGVAVPFLAHLMLAQVVGDRQARLMGLKGVFSGPKEALAMGLVDRIVEEEGGPDGGSCDVVGQAVKECQNLGASPRLGIRVAKRNNTEAVRRVFMESRKQRLDEAMELWFSAETQNYLQEAAKKF